MAPRNLKAQPIYLQPEKAEELDQLAARTRIPKAVLLREAVDDLLAKYPVPKTAADTLSVSFGEATRLNVGPKRTSEVSGNRRWPRERTEKPGAFHQDRARPVRDMHEVDRLAGTKVHRVTDAATGEVLHETVERLSQATGRGSDKPALKAARRKK